MEVSKQDWKLFCEKIANWQESYMEKLNNEYIELLEGNGTPSEKFWALEKRIKNDKRNKGVLIRMNKQDMPFDLVCLIRDGAIDFKDIEDFSSDLQEAVRFLMGRSC
ncbi:MAG: multidrug transporter [Clostridia bacterium]|nr:multidrug transporter [Clostridia bacterium]